MLLTKLTQNKTLSYKESRSCISDILSPDTPLHIKSALLTALSHRNPTQDELQAFC